ncbi:MAG: hypothetical protein ACOYOS_14045 [Syntrophales bacterium]
MQLTIGDVIFWKDFPYPRDGFIKPRWFIYLGRTGAFHTPAFLYLCTTTTQLHHFELGGNRSNHALKRFDVRQFPLFEKDCVLDFDEDLHMIAETDLKRCGALIEIKGRLDKNTMKNIFNQFSRPGVVSRVILRDIFDSFNRDEITGLKKPK